MVVQNIHKLEKGDIRYEKADEGCVQQFFCRNRLGRYIIKHQAKQHVCVK